MNESAINGSEDVGGVADTVRYIEIGYQMLLFAIGTPANLWCLFKIICSLRNHSHHQAYFGPQTWLIHLSLHLVIADLIILIGYCVFQTAWLLNYSWYGGEAGCILFHFGSTFAYHLWYLANYIVLLLVWLCLCWLLAGLAASPQFLLWGTVEIPSHLAPNAVSGLRQVVQCVFKGEEAQELIPGFFIGYQVYHVVLVFYIPLVIILIAYYGIFRILFRLSMGGGGGDARGRPMLHDAQSCEISEEERRWCEPRESRRTEARVLFAERIRFGSPTSSTPTTPTTPATRRRRSTARNRLLIVSWV